MQELPPAAYAEQLARVQRTSSSVVNNVGPLQTREHGWGNVGLLQQQNKIPLSSALRQQPGRCDGVKLSAVSCFVTHIDELPPECRGSSCNVVYLSSNSLRSLDGIGQFPGLRVLSLANNLLGQVEDLHALRACPSLEVLTLEGNPLVQLPNYRAHVVTLLPRLQTLDGKVVSAEECERAAVAVQAEAACMAVMLSNACLVHKLANAARLLQLHAELRRALFGASAVLSKCVLPTVIHVDVLKLLQLWDYEHTLGDKERSLILGALRREVVRVHRQLQLAAADMKQQGKLAALQNWDVAYSQVMLAQQRTITTLIEAVNSSQVAAQKAAGELLLGRSPPGCGLSADAYSQQEAAMAAHRLEREQVITDLRDAASSLAMHVASTGTSRWTSQTQPAGTAFCSSPQVSPSRSRPASCVNAEGHPAVGPNGGDAAELQEPGPRLAAELLSGGHRTYSFGGSAGGDCRAGGDVARSQPQETASSQGMQAVDPAQQASSIAAADRRGGAGSLQQGSSPLLARRVAPPRRGGASSSSLSLRRRSASAGNSPVAQRGGSGLRRPLVAAGRGGPGALDPSSLGPAGDVGDPNAPGPTAMAPAPLVPGLSPSATRLLRVASSLRQEQQQQQPHQQQRQQQQWQQQLWGEDDSPTRAPVRTHSGMQAPAPETFTQQLPFSGGWDVCGSPGAAGADATGVSSCRNRRHQFLNTVRNSCGVDHGSAGADGSVGSPPTIHLHFHAQPSSDAASPSHSLGGSPGAGGAAPAGGSWDAPSGHEPAAPAQQPRVVSRSGSQQPQAGAAPAICSGSSWEGQRRQFQQQQPQQQQPQQQQPLQQQLQQPPPQQQQSLLRPGHSQGLTAQLPAADPAAAAGSMQPGLLQQRAASPGGVSVSSSWGDWQAAPAHGWEGSPDGAVPQAYGLWLQQQPQQWQLRPQQQQQQQQQVQMQPPQQQQQVQHGDQQRPVATAEQQSQQQQPQAMYPPAPIADLKQRVGPAPGFPSKMQPQSFSPPPDWQAFLRTQPQPPSTISGSLAGIAGSQLPLQPCNSSSSGQPQQPQPPQVGAEASFAFELSSPSVTPQGPGSQSAWDGTAATAAAVAMPGPVDAFNGGADMPSVTGPPMLQVPSSMVPGASSLLTKHVSEVQSTPLDMTAAAPAASLSPAAATVSQLAEAAVAVDSAAGRKQPASTAFPDGDWPQPRSPLPVATSPTSARSSPRAPSVIGTGPFSSRGTQAFGGGDCITLASSRAASMTASGQGEVHTGSFQPAGMQLPAEGLQRQEEQEYWQEQRGSQNLQQPGSIEEQQQQLNWGVLQPVRSPSQSSVAQGGLQPDRLQANLVETVPGACASIQQQQQQQHQYGQRQPQQVQQQSLQQYQQPSFVQDQQQRPSQMLTPSHMPQPTSAQTLAGPDLSLPQQQPTQMQQQWQQQDPRRSQQRWQQQQQQQQQSPPLQAQRHPMVAQQVAAASLLPGVPSTTETIFTGVLQDLKAAQAIQISTMEQQLQSQQQEREQLMARAGAAERLVEDAERQAAATKAEKEAAEELLQQARHELWALEVLRHRQAAAEALSNVALCRRALLHWRETAWQQPAWREEKERLAARGRARFARWALGRLREATAQQRRLSVAQLRRQRQLQRRVLRGWHEILLRNRAEAEANTRAAEAWQRHVCLRVLQRWRFYAQHAKELRASRIAAGSQSSESETERAPAAAVHPQLPRAYTSSTRRSGSSIGREAMLLGAAPGSWTAGRYACSSPGEAGAAKGVPSDVQATFLGLRRAHSLRRRQLLRRAVAAWRSACLKARVEQAAMRRAARRHRITLLRRAWRCWLLGSAAEPGAGSAAATAVFGGASGADISSRGAPTAAAAAGAGADVGLTQAGVGTPVPAAATAAAVSAMLVPATLAASGAVTPVAVQAAEHMSALVSVAGQAAAPAVQASPAAAVQAMAAQAAAALPAAEAAAVAAAAAAGGTGSGAAGAEPSDEHHQALCKALKSLLEVQLPRLAQRRLQRQMFYAWRALTGQAAVRRRRVLRLKARQDARLQRAVLAALLENTARRRGNRVAAAAVERHHSVSCMRRALASWHVHAKESSQARAMQQRDVRRRTSDALERWRWVAAQTVQLAAAEERGQRLMQRCQLKRMRRALAGWRIQAAQALRFSAAEQLQQALRRSEAAEEQAGAMARDRAIAEERLAAVVADKGVLEQAIGKLKQRAATADAARASALAQAARAADDRTSAMQAALEKERAQVAELKAQLRAAEEPAKERADAQQQRASALEEVESRLEQVSADASDLAQQLQHAQSELEQRRAQAAGAEEARAAAAASARAADAATAAVRRAELVAAQQALAAQRREAALRDELQAERDEARRARNKVTLLEQQLASSGMFQQQLGGTGVLQQQQQQYSPSLSQTLQGHQQHAWRASQSAGATGALASSGFQRPSPSELQDLAQLRHNCTELQRQLTSSRQQASKDMQQMRDALVKAHSVIKRQRERRGNASSGGASSSSRGENRDEGRGEGELEGFTIKAFSGGRVAGSADAAASSGGLGPARQMRARAQLRTPPMTMADAACSSGGFDRVGGEYGGHIGSSQLGLYMEECGVSDAGSAETGGEQPVGSVAELVDCARDLLLSLEQLGGEGDDGY